MEDQTYSFDVYKLGFELVSKSSNTIASIQKPLKKLYISYQKAITTNPPLSQVRLNANKRGLSVDSILNTSAEQNATFMNEALITDNQVSIRAALTFTTLSTEKKNPKHKAAFVNLDPEVKMKSDKEYNSLFSSLDEKETFLVSMEHPPLFVCVNRTRTSKNLELRVFACKSNEQALDIMKALKGEIISDYSTKPYARNADKVSEASGSTNSLLTEKISNDTASNSESVNSTATSQPKHDMYYQGNYPPPQQQNPYEGYPAQQQNVHEQPPYYPQPMPQMQYPNQAYPPNAYYPYPPYGNAYPQQQFMQPYPPQQAYFKAPQIQTNQSFQPPTSNTNLLENNDIMNFANLKFPRPTIDQRQTGNTAQSDISSSNSNINANFGGANNPLGNNQLNQPNHLNQQDPESNVPKNEELENEKVKHRAISQMPSSSSTEAPAQMLNHGTQSIYPHLSPPIQQPSPPTQQFSPTLTQQLSPPSQQPSPTTQQFSASSQQLYPPVNLQSSRPSSARNSLIENSQKQPQLDEVSKQINETAPQRKERILPTVPAKKPAIPPPLQKPQSLSSPDEMFSPNLMVNGKESLHLIKPKKFMGVPVFPVNLGKTSPARDLKNKNLAQDFQRGMKLNEAGEKDYENVNSQVDEVEKGLGYVP